MRNQAVADAKRLVRALNSGVLSTISKNLQGYPFGSVTPFMSDSEGSLYIYISDIAQHAKNIREDARVSMTAYHQAERGDQNEEGRVTFVGDAVELSEQEQEVQLKRYTALFPEAESYKQAHDFNLWRIDVKRVRYIGGFGKIFWLEKDEWEAPASPWDIVSESGMISHMNEDHQDAMEAMLAHHTGELDPNVIMSGVVADGCYLQSMQKNVFIPFPFICESSTDVRKALVALTKEARLAIAS